MKNFWFGYYYWHGRINAIAWVSEDNINIGNHIDYIQRYEITERDWENQTILGLQTKHPYNILGPPTTKLP